MPEILLSAEDDPLLPQIVLAIEDDPEVLGIIRADRHVVNDPFKTFK